MKKRFFLVALLLALLTCSMALADGDVPPPDQISDNPHFSIVEWHRSVMTLDDAVKLTRTTTEISDVDSTHIYVRGVTQANKICWKIGGFMTIEQWKNNKWNTYTTLSYSAYNKTEATGEKTVTVASGYHYRLVIDHYADYDGKDEATSTKTTDSILVR